MKYPYMIRSKDSTESKVGRACSKTYQSRPKQFRQLAPIIPTVSIIPAAPSLLPPLPPLPPLPQFSPSPPSLSLSPPSDNNIINCIPICTIAAKYIVMTDMSIEMYRHLKNDVGFVLEAVEQGKTYALREMLTMKFTVPNNILSHVTYINSVEIINILLSEILDIEICFDSIDTIYACEHLLTRVDTDSRNVLFYPDKIFVSCLYKPVTSVIADLIKGGADIFQVDKNGHMFIEYLQLGGEVLCGLEVCNIASDEIDSYIHLFRTNIFHMKQMYSKDIGADRIFQLVKNDASILHEFDKLYPRHSEILHSLYKDATSITSIRMLVHHEITLTEEQLNSAKTHIDLKRLAYTINSTSILRTIFPNYVFGEIVVKRLHNRALHRGDGKLFKPRMEDIEAYMYFSLDVDEQHIPENMNIFYIDRCSIESFKSLYMAGRIYHPTAYTHDKEEKLKYMAEQSGRVTHKMLSLSIHSLEHFVNLYSECTYAKSFMLNDKEIIDASPEVIEFLCIMGEIANTDYS